MKPLFCFYSLFIYIYLLTPLLNSHGYVIWISDIMENGKSQKEQSNNASTSQLSGAKYFPDSADLLATKVEKLIEKALADEISTDNKSLKQLGNLIIQKTRQLLLADNEELNEEVEIEVMESEDGQNQLVQVVDRFEKTRSNESSTDANVHTDASNNTNSGTPDDVTSITSAATSITTTRPTFTSTVTKIASGTTISNGSTISSETTTTTTTTNTSAPATSHETSASIETSASTFMSFNTTNETDNFTTEVISESTRSSKEMETKTQTTESDSNENKTETTSTLLAEISTKKDNDSSESAANDTIPVPAANDTFPVPATNVILARKTSPQTATKTKMTTKMTTKTAETTTMTVESTTNGTESLKSDKGNLYNSYASSDQQQKTATENKREEKVARIEPRRQRPHQNQKSWLSYLSRFIA